MPAPKRGSTPHDSQPKMRKLDEDGEALPTKIESATNSLITEKKQENIAAAPRTKIKRLLVEKGNTPAKSSKQSSPPKDSSKSPSDPPVKKAKLLIATSASCGEAPSPRANSKASLKRTTSTESDEDLSSDGSKVDFFREKDDEDEAHCIRKYSNKAKRKLEELSSDPQETSQDLSSSPSDPAQIEHDYGRLSDSTSLQNTGVAEDKDSAVSFTERESQEMSHNATQKVPTDTSTSETGSAETSIKVESAADEHKDVELQYQESQTLVDHKTPAFSREMADCVTPVGEKKEKQDETESIKSQNDADDKTLASPEKTLCAVTGDIISGVQVVDERTDSCQSESQTRLTVQSVSEENELNVKSKTKEQVVSEAAGICADKLDRVLLNVTSSAPEHVGISPSDSQPKENVKMAEFTSSNAQIDLGCQLASREEFDASDIQAEMPETVVSLCDVNKTLENLEESPTDGVDVESPQTSACSEAVVEVHLSHGAVTPDSCTDTLSECEENQVEMLSDHLKVPEGQITPEAVLQSEENCLFNERLAKVATLAEGDSTGKERYMSSVQCSAAEIEGDVQTSHPDVTVQTQNQDAHESITNFHEAHSAKKCEPLENKTVGAECGSKAETQSVTATQTVVTPEISNSDPPVETRTQEIQEVSESTTVPSTEIHGNVAAEKCENMETVECAVTAEGQSGMETHLVATFKLSDPEAKVELQIQESPVSERTAVVLEGEKDPENANSDGECVDFTAENLIEVDKQTVIVSEEVCTQLEETHSHMNQEVSEHTIDVCNNAQKVVENAYCATQTLSPSQIEVHVLAAATSEEVSNVARVEETQTPMVSEPTTETYKVQNEPENVNCAAQSQIKVVDNVQAAATSENISNVVPIEQMQITMDSEPVTDAPDDAYTDLENAAFKSSKDVICVSAAARSQIEVGVDTSASEKVSMEEMQSQIVSEPTMHTSVKFIGDHWEEHLKTVENNEFKCDSPTVTLSQMVMCTTLAVESSSPTPASCVNRSQAEEDMRAPENSSSTAFVVETQTPLIIQDVSGQARDHSNQELHENIIVENLQKVKNKDEVHSGCVTAQEDRLKSEMQVTPASVVLEADGETVEMHKSPNEMHTQTVTSDQDSVFPAVEMQNLQSLDVMEEHMDTISVADEESQNKMETTETSVLSPSAETQYQISNNVNDSSANVSEQVQANFRTPANENKAVEECVRTAVGTNKMETQSAEGLQEHSQPTATKQIPSQRGQEVCELTTDTNSLVLQSSTETQVQKSFSVAESFTVPSTEDHENKSEECIDTAETTHEMETQSPQTLAVSQPTTSENTQIQRGQEVSELAADISVSPPPPETQTQRSCDVTEPSSEGSTTVQEDVKIHSNEGDENENAMEHICATDGMYKMEIQTTEELQEMLPTTEQGEATELTTNISASPPSSETHVQKNLNITESATNTFVCNENTAVEKSSGATERTIEMEMQAAEMLLEVSQPAFTKRQKLRDQEVCELTTDTNVSFLPSSSEIKIQKSFIVTSPANDASETDQESFRVPLNRHENGNDVLTECGSTAGRTNKMETQSVQTLEEVSQATITEQTHNQRVQEFSEVTTDPNLSVSPASAELQTHRSLDVSEAPTHVSETDQEMFKSSSSECRENENKAFEKCADTAEMTIETEMQTSEALEETFKPPTTEQTHNQRGQKVIELSIDADVSVAPLLAGTTIQRSMDITQPASDKSITFQEKFKISPNEINKNENKAMKECVHTAERTNKTEMHPPELLQEVCQPTITEQTQNQINDPISTEREQNQNYVITSENHPKIDMQTSLLTPEVYYQKSEVELQNQRNTDVSEEMDASECENVPEVETDMEASAKSEISYLAAVVDHKKHLAEETTEHTMHLSDEILTPQPSNYENKEHDEQTEPEIDREDVTSGSMERTDSALEEDIKVEASVRSAEGGTERSEVIVFVSNQSDDTVIQAADEQKTVHQTEVEFYENQVVYEPISSPESNSGEVCTPIQLGETISFLDLQSADTHHILNKESNFFTRDDKLVITHPKLEDEEIVKVEMCASDCAAAVLMEVDATSEAQCPAHVHLEQSNETDDVTHIAATDGRSQSASKESERWDVLEHISAAALTEQMQEDTEVHDATVIMATTPSSTEIEITDASSEQMQEDTGIMVTTPAPTEVKITDASSEWVQEDTGVQDATVVVATNPSSTEVAITDASSEQVQEDTAVQDATVMATATPAQTEVEVADASSEQMQEYIEDEEATGIVATATPALTEVEITDASSEQVQEDTGVQDATTFMAAATPAPTEVEVVDASSEQMQEDTEVQDATVVMATSTPALIEIEITDVSSEQVQEDTGVQNTTVITATTPASTEVEITDASSEQVQEVTGVQNTTVITATTTTGPTEVEITDASSEQVHEDTGVQDATVVVATNPSSNEVEMSNASSEHGHEDTGVQDATTYMTTASPASTEVEITNASCEQVQESIENEEATGIAATSTPALIEIEITDASSEQVQEDTGVQDSTVIMATTPASTEVEITDSSSEQVHEDTGVQDATVVMATNPSSNEVEMTSASSVHEDTGVQDAITYMATAPPASTEVEITNASCEQVQESIENEEATGIAATSTPALTEVEVVDVSSELMQEEIVVDDALVVMTTPTPAPIEVEVVDASSEQMQEDTGAQDATANMATTPVSFEVDITNSSSEQMQEDTLIQDATTNMATATLAPIEFQITDASSEQMQHDAGIQDTTVIMATIPSPTGVEITNASSEQVQEDPEVQDTTVVMVTPTPAPTEVEKTDAPSERVQEDTEVQDATVVMVTPTTAPTEVEKTDAPSERVQECTEVQDTTVVLVTAAPAPTEVEITDASSEQVQQDAGIQDATVVMVTATPKPAEGEITDASSEQVQEDTGVSGATVVMVTTTTRPTEVEVEDVSSEQMQVDTGIQDTTANMVTTTPAPTEVEKTDAPSERVQEDTEVQDATVVMVTPTTAPTEVEKTDASSEQVQQDAGIQDATVVMVTTTPAPTEAEITDASSEQVQEYTEVQDATVVTVTSTPEPTEGEITDASSEQLQQDVGIQDATVVTVTSTPKPSEGEITDASSEQVQEDTGVPGATVVMVTTTRQTEVEVEDASSEQMQVDTGIQDTTANLVTTPEPTEAEITDASSEQVQEDTGVPDATDNMVTTTSASTEGQVVDASAEDYVILEPVPVPESEIHFDIVTQAVAESGLSASLGPDEEMASQSILNSTPQTIILEAVAHQGETTHEVNSTTVTSSGDVLEQETEANSLQDAPVSDDQPSSASVDVEMVNCHHTNNDSAAAVMENVECTPNQDEVQMLEVMEIGREVVVMEEYIKEDSDVVIIKPPAQPTEGSKKSEKEVNVTKKQDASKTVKRKASAGKAEEIKGQEVEKPKKQEMNMQARTKARLAALAEQKAAAAKRSANRQQLNLLALCQEIAEDIATDSMLLKKIEEEKQAAAAAEAANKAKAIKKEHPAVTSQEAEPDHVVTPAGPEESPTSETPTPELPADQPSTADSAEPKPAAEPPKRRFFISQISVPLKAHEKKKLTRYQRLRQVELQREKMSWARVKKFKSDQTNQMFSDVDWQASFSGGFFMGSATPPQASSPSKAPPVSQTPAAQPAQSKGDAPKTETPASELAKTEVDKTEPTKTENPETELLKTEMIKTEPAKAETCAAEPIKVENSKTEPIKAETTKTEAPNFDNRRITRQSKAQASKAAVSAPKPAPKVTRSTSKRSLPAVPPPMPNGLNTQKPKPVEYKPYRPRPKYSFDDFELDDDDSLLVSTIKPNLSTQPPRPCPAAQSKPPLKPTISSQPANQAKLKSQTAPPGPVRPTAAVQARSQSAKAKPTVAAAAQLNPATASSSKPVPSTSTQLKTPILAAPQSKPASVQPKPAASASPQLKAAGVNVTAPAAPHPNSPAPTETKPAAAKTGDASAPQKTENPPSQENETCKNTADPPSSLPASSLPSVESTDGTKTSDESPADTAPHSSAENETKTAKMAEKTSEIQNEAKPQDAATFLSDASLQKEVKKLKEADKDGTQTIIDAGQKHFGPVACSGCGMLYSAANPEDESQHLLFHNQFVSAVKYVGWKKERILAEFPDGKIILVLPDDPKYALKKVEEIREMVDNDLGFQQVETKCPSQTKTFLFISIDKKVAGCLIAEHIQEGYRVIEEALPEGSEGEKVLFERQKAWCCSTTPDPAVCGISRIWVVSMMRRRGIATRMIECLRNNFIYGSYLRKDEIAFSDPTPDGKLFASHYFGTSQFLVYNFVSGLRSLQPKTQAV